MIPFAALGLAEAHIPEIIYRPELAVQPARDTVPSLCGSSSSDTAPGTPMTRAYAPPSATEASLRAAKLGLIGALSSLYGIETSLLRTDSVDSEVTGLEEKELRSQGADFLAKLDALVN